MRKLVVLALALTGIAYAQTHTLSSSTLSAAMDVNQQYIQLVSIAGVARGKAIYVDREFLNVKPTYDGVSLTVPVTRGQSRAAHASGAASIAGSPAWFYAGNATGACTLSLTFASPWVNIVNGNQYLCTAGAWVLQGAGGGAGSVTVVGAGNLGNTQCVTGGGAQAIQTPSTGCSIDASGNLIAASFTGGDASHSAGLLLPGLTSGAVQIAVADVAGTAIAYILPTTNGTAGQVLSDSGAVTCPTLAAGSPAVCHQMVWIAAAAGSGVVPIMIPTYAPGNPAASATYGIGPFGWVSLTTPVTTCNGNGAFLATVVPVSGTISGFTANVGVFGTLSSAGSVTFTLLKNCTATAMTMTQSWTTAVPAEVSDTTHTVSVTAGDTLVIQVATPAWVTAPTNVYVQYSVKVTGAS